MKLEQKYKTQELLTHSIDGLNTTMLNFMGSKKDKTDLTDFLQPISPKKGGTVSGSKILKPLHKMFSKSMLSGIIPMFKHFGTEFFGWLKDGFGKTFDNIKGSINDILGKIKTTFIDPIIDLTKSTFNLLKGGVKAFFVGAAKSPEVKLLTEIRDAFKRLFKRQDREQGKDGKSAWLKKFLSPITFILGAAIGFIAIKLAALTKPLGMFLTGVKNIGIGIGKLFGEGGKLSGLSKLKTRMLKFFNFFGRFGKFFKLGIDFGKKILLPIEGLLRIAHQLWTGEGWEEKISGIGASLTSMFLELPAMVIEWVTNKVLELFGSSSKIKIDVSTAAILKMTNELGTWLGNKTYDMVQSIKGFFDGLPSMISGSIVDFINNKIPDKIFGFSVVDKKQAIIKSIMGGGTAPAISPTKSAPNSALSDAITTNKTKQLAITKKSSDDTVKALEEQTKALKQVNNILTDKSDKKIVSNTSTVNAESSVVAPVTNVNNNQNIQSSDPEFILLGNNG